MTDSGSGASGVVVSGMTAIGAVVGSAVTYVLNKLTSTRDQRRKKVAGWRRWVESYATDMDTVRKSSVWSEIRWYASTNVRELVEGKLLPGKPVPVLSHVIVLGDSRNSHPRTLLLDEITRIEHEWRLV